MTTHNVKPLIKWVGGKTQIIDRLIKEMPKEINNYHEIFLGGGSVLLAVLSHMKSNHIKVKGAICASDLNEQLIYLYQNIQTKHTELFEEVQRLVHEFNSCTNGDVNRQPKSLQEAQLNKENYYYYIRRRYNELCSSGENSVVLSAMFLFLNKTCFRGLYRVGPNGFNVPYGNYKNPEIVNRAHLNEVHELIQGVVFEVNDFVDSMKKVSCGDYVYLDPPYAPESETSFVKYTDKGFDINEHKKLFAMIHDVAKHSSIMMSNADVEFVRKSFQAYDMDAIVCKRAINSKNPEAKTTEVIIKNY